MMIESLAHVMGRHDENSRFLVTLKTMVATRTD